METKSNININALEKFCESLVDEMLKVGEDIAINNLGHINTGETLTSIQSMRTGMEGTISANGAAMWLEFGTGVAKNNGLHPMANQPGISAIGTYGRGQGANPNGWNFPTKDGQWRHTKGIAQTRFMYNTSKYLEEHAQEITDKVAKEWSK